MIVWRDKPFEPVDNLLGVAGQVETNQQGEDGQQGDLGGVKDEGDRLDGGGLNALDGRVYDLTEDRPRGKVNADEVDGVAGLLTDLFHVGEEADDLIAQEFALPDDDRGKRNRQRDDQRPQREVQQAGGDPVRQSGVAADYPYDGLEDIGRDRADDQGDEDDAERINRQTGQRQHNQRNDGFGGRVPARPLACE